MGKPMMSGCRIAKFAYYYARHEVCNCLLCKFEICRGGHKEELCRGNLLMVRVPLPSLH